MKNELVLRGIGKLWIALFLIALPLTGTAAEKFIGKLELKAPPVALKNIPFSLKIRALNEKGDLLPVDGKVTLKGASTKSGKEVLLKSGEIALEDAIVNQTGVQEISAQFQGLTGSTKVRGLYGILSILPPLLAIVIAIISRQFVLALFAGVWLGAFFLRDFNPIISFLYAMDHFLMNAIADSGHAAVLLFTLTLGAMVALIYRNGGTRGIVDWLSRYAVTRRGGQISTWCLGLLIFFDDYLNSLIVGNTMRSITDRLKISREKLAFIVDATAAPVASIALVSTWIGTEVSLIGDSVKELGLPGDPYGYFLESIPYRFYPILMLFFVVFIAWTRRDLFSMQQAESRTITTGKVSREGANIAYDISEEKTVQLKDDTPCRARNAILPILTVVIVTFIGLWVSGSASATELPPGIIAKLRTIIGGSDSYQALMWGSLSGTTVAIILSLAQRILSLAECFDAFMNGIKSMVIAAVILTLAWSIGAVTSEVHTSQYLVSILSNVLAPQLLPVLVFVSAALMSFATGTSWGTMAVLMPITIPLCYSTAQAAGLSPDVVHTILVGGISSVLAGSVFGDHCSPISDTTVMSSIASGCDHIDHVRTQLPYAVIVALVAMFLGDIPSAYGLSPWISLLLGVVAIILIVRFFGRPNEAKETG